LTLRFVTPKNIGLPNDVQVYRFKMSNAIELLEVTKTFGKQTAVDSLDLTVPEGSIYGFIGPNGSGKTTTLRMILRIFQPDSGIVRVLDETEGETADNRLGYLPEERGLYKRMRVVDVLKYYARLKGFYDCMPEINYWLDRLGARQWSRKKVDALSKGMAQKIQFIASVVAKPKLVILDEPFSGLDPVNLESLRDAVFSLRERGTTIVFSTHDMDMAEKMCDTIFMIFNGKKVLDGTLDSIQATFPANRVRIRVAEEGPLPELVGVTKITDNGRFHDFLLDETTNSQVLLQQLTHSRTVTHFEVVRPSLHDIFVSIARPES
jgi:ABC-2 type transport system ATP-binding protein